MSVKCSLFSDEIAGPSPKILHTSNGNACIKTSHVTQVVLLVRVTSVSVRLSVAWLFGCVLGCVLQVEIITVVSCHT